MKRSMCAALVLGIATTAGLSGCGEESSVKKEVTVDTPTGKRTITEETKVKETGDLKDGATTPAPNP